jgi:hypothetical protein
VWLGPLLHHSCSDASPEYFDSASFAAGANKDFVSQEIRRPVAGRSVGSRGSSQSDVLHNSGASTRTTRPIPHGVLVCTLHALPPPAPIGAVPSVRHAQTGRGLAEAPTVTAARATRRWQPHAAARITRRLAAAPQPLRSSLLQRRRRCRHRRPSRSRARRARGARRRPRRPARRPRRACRRRHACGAWVGRGVGCKVRHGGGWGQR